MLFFFLSFFLGGGGMQTIPLETFLDCLQESRHNATHSQNEWSTVFSYQNTGSNRLCKHTMHFRWWVRRKAKLPPLSVYLRLHAERERREQGRRAPAVALGRWALVARLRRVRLPKRGQAQAAPAGAGPRHRRGE